MQDVCQRGSAPPEGLQRGSPVEARLARMHTRLLVPLLLLLLLPASAGARTDTGAGSSLAVGATAFDPAPLLGFEMSLPTLEIAVGLDLARPAHLRLRLPLLDTLLSGVARQQLDLQADLFLLITAGGKPAGSHRIRPVLGPMLGARLNAQAGVVQPGFAVGGRFGAEYLGPESRFGLTIALEPLFQLQGGPAGLGRTSTTLGGGGFLVVAVTGYQRPTGEVTP